MSASIAYTPPRSGLISVTALGDKVIWFAVFLSGFVIFEPAPYELFLAAAIPLFFLGGLKLRASFGPLVVCLLCFMAGGILSTTQTGWERFDKAIIYMATTLFLAVTGVWYAALIAENWRRIRIIEQAYIVGSVIVSLIGILAYFRAIPGSDAFMLYGRAKSTFQDPNVFGPYLLIPTMLLAHRLMVGPFFRQMGTVICFAILLMGMFLSFSRNAWGMIALGLVLLAMVVSATFATNRERIGLLGKIVIGAAALVVLLAILASIPAVYDILVQRAKLVQDYDGKDGAQLGRFARHWAGFLLSTEHPLGIGPWEFDRLYVEDTHNAYLKSIMEYGWLGFVSWVTMIFWTLYRAWPLMFKPRPWQGFAQVIVVCFIVHMLGSWLIDMDHWRHFFMILGLVWGLSAADRYYIASRRRQAEAVSPAYPEPSV